MGGPPLALVAGRHHELAIPDRGGAVVTPPALDWLRQMNGGIAARHLYPPEHPQVVDALSKLHAATEQLTADRLEVALFVVEGRLSCDGDVVPGADGMADGVFRLLQTHGFHRVTLRVGATRDELERLMSGLAEAARSGPGALKTLQSTPHVRLSSLEGDTPEPDPRLDEAIAVGISELQGLWQHVDAQRAIDMRALDRILAPLVDTVNEPRGNALPLVALARHDDYTATHITNVALLTMALAQAVGMPQRGVREIGVAALLHDIGKMRIPAEILSAPGRLTTEQLSLVRCHPEIGARMLIETPGIPHLAVMVAYEHHIQSDGGGYPEVPHGWPVGVASAMTHVADVYDALRTNRPYRSSLPHDTIVEMMMRDRGTVFSAPLLELFFDRVVPRTAAGAVDTASASVSDPVTP